MIQERETGEEEGGRERTGMRERERERGGGETDRYICYRGREAERD